MVSLNILKNSAWRFTMWSSFFFIVLCLFASCSRGSETSDVELLTNEVYQMRQCQRRAQNIDFYLHKYEAEKVINRYLDDWSSMSSDNQHAFLLAHGRYHIVLSDYHLQTGNTYEALKEIDALSTSSAFNQNVDTALWLNYLSHQAKVRFFPYDVKAHRQNIEKGYDCLVQCYILASRNDYPLYEAVSMQILSEYLLNDSILSVVEEFDPASIRYINAEAVPDSLLAFNLAERALRIFLMQGDYYMTADAWRNLARCYFSIGQADRSIECLNNALANPVIDSMPDLKASIAEQMSMSYAALDDKYFSDVYRNLYLDLQDSTRMDRQLEARIVAIENTTHRIWALVAIAFGVFLLLCLLTFLLIRIRNRKSGKSSASADELELLEDDLRTLRLQGSNAQRAMIEQLARVSYIKGMLPLIDRMKLAIGHGHTDFVRELADDIERQNSMLTDWIKLRQGTIAPRIETFRMSDVLSVIAQNTASLASQGVSLSVDDSEASVKADRSLTLFILNTLVDNARKAIGKEGEIIVSCTEGDNYLEVSVSDSGKGMTEQQLDHLFDSKPLVDSAQATSHGFGLQNCRGIIERYRKMSSVFSVCAISAKSKVGEGTTVSFRLPLAARMLLLLLMSCFSLGAVCTPLDGKDKSVPDSTLISYADSLYQCNVEGRYAEAIHYADSCAVLMRGAREIDTTLALYVYNETAVAALAMHDWNKYRYYNYQYTSLYKQYTTDPLLSDYCRQMELRSLWANIAMLVVLLLIMALIPVFWFAYLRPMLKSQRDLDRRKTAVRDEIAKEKLENDRFHVLGNIMGNQMSAIKHETMYYPSRIRQIIEKGMSDDLSSVVNYYSSLYSALLRPLLISRPMLFPVHSYPLKELFGVDTSQTVRMNKELAAYLLLLLKRHNGGTSPQAGFVDGELRFAMQHSDITPENIAQLFTPQTPHADYLVMRQIIRETADATMAYKAGITARIIGMVPTVVINF